MSAPVAAAGKRRPYTANWRSAVLRSRLPVAAKVTLFALAEYADADGGSCFPSIVRVAELAGVNERTARRSLDAGVQAGLITRANRGGSSQGWRRYTYQLLIPQGSVAVASTDGGADTMTARSDEGAGVMSARSVGSAGSGEARCGHSRQEVRALTPEGAGVMSTDLVHDLAQHQEEAAHLAMRAGGDQGRHHGDIGAQASAIDPEALTWAMQHAPAGKAADHWPAWVRHALPVHNGTDAGLRRKLLAEARYLETCTDPVAEIDSAIELGAEFLSMEWMQD